MNFENKLIAVVNEKLEPGVAMNALAHMCIGFGASIGTQALKLTTYQDANGTQHPNISEMPFIILKANSNKLRTLRIAAKEQNIACVDFTDTMTGGTYLEQIEKTMQTKEENLIYYGVVLFGKWPEVTELTKKFSLWK